MSSPDANTVNCPTCHTLLNVSGATSGQKIHCPVCERDFNLPPLGAAPSGSIKPNGGATAIRDRVDPPRSVHVEEVPTEQTFQRADVYEAPEVETTASRRNDMPTGGDIPADSRGSVGPSSTTAGGTRSAPHYPAVGRLSMPNDVPAALLRSERSAGLVSMVFGVGIGVVAGFVLAATGGNSMLGHVFSLRSATSAIPFAILCVFFWGLFICFFRYRKLRAVDSRMQEADLSDLAHSLRTQGVEAQLNALKTYKICDVHPLYRQLRAVLDQWLQRPNLQNADILIQKYEVIDADALQGAYGLVRTFVWAMPVLGLIGTVIGISLAVGGFANFLGGSVDDVGAIKTSLVSVTSGLSFAFLITLEGLLGALLTMLPTSYLQSLEQAQLNRVQSFLADTYLPTLTTVMPERGLDEVEREEESVPGFELIQLWRDAMTKMTQEATSAIRSSAHAVVSDLQSYHEANKVAIDQEAALITRTIQAVADHSSRSADDFVTRVQILSESLDADRKSFHEQERVAWNQQNQLHQSLIRQLESQSERFSETTRAVGQLSDISTTALRSQEAVTQSLEQIGRMNVSGISEVIEGYGRTLASAQSAVGGQMHTLESVLQAQRDLQTAVRQLEQINFVGTMSDLRSVMERLTPLLKMLSRPQLVLMSTEGEP